MNLALKLAEGKFSRNEGKPRCKIVNILLADSVNYSDEVRYAVKHNLPIIIVPGSEVCNEILRVKGKLPKEEKPDGDDGDNDNNDDEPAEYKKTNDGKYFLKY